MKSLPYNKNLQLSYPFAQSLFLLTPALISVHCSTFQINYLFFSLSLTVSFFLSFQFQDEEWKKQSTDSMNSSKCMQLCVFHPQTYGHTMKWNAIETFPVQGLHGCFYHCIHICCTPIHTHPTHTDKKRQHSKVSGEKLFNYSRHESTNVWKTQPYTLYYTQRV